MLIFTNQLHFLITCVWHVLNVNASRTKQQLRNTERCSYHEFLLEQLKNFCGKLEARLLEVTADWRRQRAPRHATMHTLPGREAQKVGLSVMDILVLQRALRF